MNIDLIIVGIYLAITLVIGVLASKGVHTVKDYAIGSRKFSTPIMIATISATLLGGGSTIGMAENVYSYGVAFIFLFFGDAIAKLIIAQFIVPRFEKFTDMISVGDIMERSYGKLGKVLTGICGTLLLIGNIGAQLTAIGYLVNSFYGISFELSILIGFGIVILYSSMGGIRAVAITDMIQFIVLIIAIPMICNIGINTMGGYSALFKMAPDKAFSMTYGKGVLDYMMLFIIFCIPFLNPTVVQRLLMGQNPTQVARSFRIAALIDIPFYMIVGCIGLMALALYPNIDPNLALPHLINTLLPHGIKGLAVAGTLAVIMSTADSYLNSAAISLVHDAIKPLSRNELSDKQELFLTRIVTIVIGACAIIAALSFRNVMDIVINFLNIWGPTIVIPLYAAVFDIKASKKAFIYSVIAGLSTFIVWKIFALQNVFGVGSLVPSMIVNGMMFFIVNKTKKNGVIVSPQVKAGSQLIHVNTRPALDGLSSLYSSFCEHVTRSIPQYIAFGAFAVINFIVPCFMWPTWAIASHNLYVLLRVVAGVLSALLIIKDYWPESLKKFLPLYWYITLLFCLPFMTTFMLTVSNFETSWLINIALASFLLAVLVDWLSFVVLLFSGTALGYLFFSITSSNSSLLSVSNETKFLVAYILIFSSSIGLIFSRNKEYIAQKIMEAKDEINKTLKEVVAERTIDLKDALNAKKEFLGKVSHEVRTPLHGVVGMSKELAERWNEMDNSEKHKLALAAAENSDRLMGFISNILDISQFSECKGTANFEKHVNVVELIQDAIKVSEDLSKDIIFRLDIEEDARTEIDVDKARLKQVLVSVIQNAVQYSEKGTIKIRIGSEAEKMKISIMDEGIGLPEQEKISIFEAFAQSSRTRDPSKGKGLGLTLAREIMHMHSGKIWAENNSNGIGCMFTILLPYEQPIEEKKAPKIVKSDSLPRIRARVLLVDDERICLQMASMYLEKIGCRVVAVSGGTQALEYLKTHSKEVDLILLDLMMPDIYGLNVLEMLKKDPRLKHIPVIIQSGLLDASEIAKSVQLGAIGHIPKPYVKENIIDAVTKVVKLFEKMDSIA